MLGFESRVATRFLREGRMQTVLIIVGVAAGVAVVAYISALITGLHDLAGLDQARQHARIGRCGEHGLGQAGLGGGAGRAGQRQLRLCLGDLRPRLGVGGALRACSVQLRLRHCHRAAHLVQARLAEEALGHQVQRALQFGLRGHAHRLCLRLPPRSAASWPR